MLVTCTGCRGRAVGLQLDAEGLCGHCHRVRHGTAQAAQRKQLLSTSRKCGTGSSSRAAQKPDDSSDDSDSDADSEADEPAAKPIAKPTAAKPSRRSCVDDPFPVCDPARGVRLDAARSSLPDAGDAGAFSSLPAEQHGQGEAGPLGAQPLPRMLALAAKCSLSGRGRPSRLGAQPLPRVLELAASKATHMPA